MRDLLYKKFTDVPTRPGRGGTYSFIRWQDVADRMNQIFGINWSSETVQQEVVNSNVIIRLRVTVVDPETGNICYQEGFGGAPMDDRQEAGNPFKSAYSKALKDACKKWGIALFIDEDEPTMVEKPAVVPVQAVPQPTQSVPAPVVPTETIPVPDTVNQAPPVPVQPVNQVPFEAPTMAPPQQAFETVPESMVNVPPVPITPVVPVQTGPRHGQVIGGAQTTISDVQKAALQSILNIQGVEYGKLVGAAFKAANISVPDAIPAMDNLSYKEAVVVVKYGNDQHRRR